jgi:hypothetical protein
MIRFADEKDIDIIMEFMRDYVNSANLLGRNRSYFEFEYRYDDKLSFVISVTKKKIDGVLGYMPYGKINRDVMITFCKVKDPEDNTLASELVEYLVKNVYARIIAGIGSNANLFSIYRNMGYEVSKYTQWYRLRKLGEYRIASIDSSSVPKIGFKEQLRWREIRDYSDLDEKMDLSLYTKEKYKPYKDGWYIRRHYFEHPRYNYRIFAIYNDEGRISTVFFLRVEHYNGSKAVRFVDCIGDYSLIANITSEIDIFMEREDAEYIDMYEAGLDEKMLKKAGWLRTADTENIIPDSFSPFVCENKDLFYFSSDRDVVLFKGESNQDCPCDD